MENIHTPSLHSRAERSVEVCKRCCFSFEWNTILYYFISKTLHAYVVYQQIMAVASWVAGRVKATISCQYHWFSWNEKAVLKSRVVPRQWVEFWEIKWSDKVKNKQKRLLTVWDEQTLTGVWSFPRIIQKIWQCCYWCRCWGCRRPKGWWRELTGYITIVVVILLFSQ